MITLKVKDKGYKLKFGYKSFKESGVLHEVVEMQKKLQDAKSENGIEALEDVFELNSKLLLAALQKYNEEFRVDYNDKEAVQMYIDKVDNFIDDYMEEENAMSIMELFSTLSEELFNNGFLSKKSEKLEKALTEQNATVIPIDHKQIEN